AGSRWARQGMEPILPELGMQVLAQVLRRGAAHLTILPIDWSTYLRARGAQPPLLAEIAREAQAKSHKPAAKTAAPVLLQQLEGAAPDQQRQIVIDFIRDQARMVFQLTPDYPIDQRQSFNELGLDSLMAVELRNALGSSVNTTLPATLLFDYPTFEAVADYILRDVLALTATAADTAAAAAQAQAEQAEQTALAELDELSDEEAEALLAAELNNLR
ncbi:MAG: hypothetical protein KC425_09285, partial [Anaerolineales bacterium]|nr:hypothetical protein [Anaerolineales bacterium]